MEDLEQLGRRVLALEFVIETFMARAFADMPPIAVENFTDSLEARGGDATAGTPLDAAGRAAAIERAEGIGRHVTHLAASLRKRTAEIRASPS